MSFISKVLIAQLLTPERQQNLYQGVFNYADQMGILGIVPFPVFSIQLLKKQTCEMSEFFGWDK
jgi:hypothetical protein